MYYENEVLAYIVNESKLDSPSSSRYDMLNLTFDGNRVFFTLNLQVRYKK